MKKLRTVIEEERVLNIVDQARNKYKRFEEVFEAIKWRLARNPESGMKISDTNPPYYILKTLDFNIPGVPTIIILYRYNENEVNILSIRIK